MNGKDAKQCTNCPGATDHDTASCPLMSKGNARNENIIGMRKKIKTQAEHIARLEFRIAEQRKVLRGEHPEQAEGAQGEREAFKREDRYIVIKQKDLNSVPAVKRVKLSEALSQVIPHLPEREFLVIESDWPEYEPAWKAIEARVSGTLCCQQDGLKPCPFCGGKARLTHDDYVHEDMRPMPVVECTNCHTWVRAESWNKRAALAQPSPTCSACHGSEMVFTDKLDHNGNHIEVDCPDCAQPSPAPELERPEVVAHLNEWRDRDQGGIRVTPALSAMSEDGLQKEYGPEASVVRREPLMTVSQHNRIGLQWASLVHRAQAKADAAQARVAELETALAMANDAAAKGEDARAILGGMELEKQEPVLWVTFDNGYILDVTQDKAIAEEWMRAEWPETKPLYAAPVAQAGQVPEWIACVDRMPPVNENVLVSCEFCTNDWRIKVGGIDERGNWWVYGASWTPSRWQPLPAAPAQGGRDE